MTRSGHVSPRPTSTRSSKQSAPFPPRTPESQIQTALAESLPRTTAKLGDGYYAAYHASEIALRADTLGSHAAHSYLNEAALRGFAQSTEEVLRIKQALLQVANQGPGWASYAPSFSVVFWTVLVVATGCACFFLFRDKTPEAVNSLIAGINKVNDKVDETARIGVTDYGKLAVEQAKITNIIDQGIKPELAETNFKIEVLANAFNEFKNDPSRPTIAMLNKLWDSLQSNGLVTNHLAGQITDIEKAVEALKASIGTPKDR